MTTINSPLSFSTPFLLLKPRNHPQIHNMLMWLTAPNGAILNLFYQTGYTGANLNTNFTDAGALKPNGTNAAWITTPTPGAGTASRSDGEKAQARTE